MKRPWCHGGGYSIVGVGVVVALLFVGRVDVTVSAAPPQPVPVENLFQQAESLLKRRRTFGEHAIRVVADKRAQYMDRKSAAFDLGQIRYRPAVPTLLECDNMDETLRRFRTAPLSQVVAHVLAFARPDEPWHLDSLQRYLAGLAPYSTQCARGFLLEPEQTHLSRRWARWLLDISHSHLIHTP